MKDENKATRWLPVPLSMEETAERSTKMCGLLDEADQVEAEGAAQAKSAKARAAGLREEAALLRRVIVSGEENRQVDVVVERHADSGLEVVIRLDTGARVSERPLSPEEIADLKQRRLPLGDVPKEVAAEGTPRICGPVDMDDPTAECMACQAKGVPLRLVIYKDESEEHICATCIELTQKGCQDCGTPFEHTPNTVVDGEDRQGKAWVCDACCKKRWDAANDRPDEPQKKQKPKKDKAKKQKA